MDISDAALAWPMLRPSGILIFDDYEWTYVEGETARPKLGIDAFLARHQGRYQELHRGYQLIIAKR